jgi:hypothetical protein
LHHGCCVSLVDLWCRFFSCGFLMSEKIMNIFASSPFEHKSNQKRTRFGHKVTRLEYP